MPLVTILYYQNLIERSTLKMQLIEKPTVEVRGDEAVVIFPSRPYWFSATKEVATVLNILQTEVDEETAIPCVRT